MVNLYLDPHGRTIFLSTTAQQQQMSPSQMKQGKSDGVGSNDNNPADDAATEPGVLNENRDEKTKMESQSKEVMINNQKNGSTVSMQALLRCSCLFL